MRIGVARKTAIGSFSIAVFASSLLACSLLVDTSGLEGGAGADGGADADADAVVPAEATLPEAASEAGLDACAAPPEPAPIVPFDAAKWTLLGAAAVDVTGVLLTPQVADEAGAVWSNDVFTFERFEVTVGLRIDDGDGDKQIADGMTFSWVPGALPAATGEKGGGLGAGGLNGYAVALDTFTDPKTDPKLEVLDSSRLVADSQWVLTETPTPSPDLLGSEHILRVRLDSGGIVTVTFDGTVAIDHFTIPGYVAGRGHWGLTAATGGVSSLQRVTRVTFVDLTKPCP